MAKFYFEISYSLNGSMPYKEFEASSKEKFYEKLKPLWDEASKNIGFVKNEPFLTFETTNRSGDTVSIYLGEFSLSDKLEWDDVQFERSIDDEDALDNWLLLGLEISDDDSPPTGDEVLDLIFNFERSD